MDLNEDNSQIKALVFNADNKEGLTYELYTFFSNVDGAEFCHASEILIYIDATNGNLFLCGFIKETGELLDNKGIEIELPEFWEQHDNAYDFDEIVITSLKHSFKMVGDGKVIKNYKLYYQTETESEQFQL
jgi:hypothetical protein